MFKIIKFDTESNSQVNDWYRLMENKPIIQKEYFERTKARINLTDIVDLEKRSSWTHELKFTLYLPEHVTHFFEQNNILYEKNNGNCCDCFSLLKYETGDFFLNHRDTDLSNALDNLIHQYTCLIFCPYGDDNNILKGGELMLKHPDGLYEIKFDPSVETNKNRFVMVIFSIDMYHEVLPIISGSRYVFKKPLFVKRISTIIEERNDVNVDELCDGGGGGFGFNNTGDY